MNTVKDFWDQMAVEHKTDDAATAPDHFYRQLEISRIMPHLVEQADILDIGCGNGYSTLKFAEAYPKSRFTGADYSEEMIRQAGAAAKANRKRNIQFTTANILTLHTLHSKYDIIISERCLINLASWEEQKQALMQLKYALNPGGKVILVENTQEGLANLNKLRAQFELPAIEVRWHNKYLPQRELTDFLKLNFKIMNVENIGNLYYLMSRVLYAKLAQNEGETPKYDHPINEIASKMPSLPGYHYSPNFMFILRGLT